MARADRYHAVNSASLALFTHFLSWSRVYATANSADEERLHIEAKLYVQSTSAPRSPSPFCLILPYEDLHSLSFVTQLHLIQQLHFPFSFSFHNLSALPCR